MPGLLADVNVEGHLAMLVQRVEGPTWREVWAALEVEVVTFASLGLARDVADATLWHECQRQQVVLITGNRNAEGPESLEATIRAFNTPDSLPILTLADPPRIFRDRTMLKASWNDCWNT